MNISRDLIIPAAIAVAFVILVLIFVRIFGHKESALRRNLTRRQGRILWLVMITLIACTVCAWVMTFKQSGTGRLFSDADSPTEAFTLSGDHEVSSDIMIEGGSVIVAGRSYSGIDEARANIIALTQSGADITVIDRYGRADTVVEVIGLLKSNGADIDIDDVVIYE